VHRFYVRVQFLAIGSSLDFHETLAGILGSQPERAASIRRRYRDLFARPIRRWSVLSANYRTVGIFLCALLKAPLLYFFFEVVGFSLILAWLTVRQHGRFALFLEAWMPRIEPRSTDAHGGRDRPPGSSAARTAPGRSRPD